MTANMALELEDQISAENSKRGAERRTADNCVSVIDGRTYPVLNWSTGGVQIFADSKVFSVGSDVPMTLKFKLFDKIMDVAHTARVVRKNANSVALQFAPLSRDIQKSFRAVIDDYVTMQFAESQNV